MTVVHSAEDVEMLLRRGLSPITDNRDALIALGFERAYPQVRTGRESTIWERAIEHHPTSDGHRTLARQRAYLIHHTS
jgi:hypothetical protein